MAELQAQIQADIAGLEAEFAIKLLKLFKLLKLD